MPLLTGLTDSEPLLAFATPPTQESADGLVQRIKADLHPGQLAFVAAKAEVSAAALASEAEQAPLSAIGCGEQQGESERILPSHFRGAITHKDYFPLFFDFYPVLISSGDWPPLRSHAVWEAQAVGSGGGPLAIRKYIS